MSEQLDHQPAQQELPSCSRHPGHLCSGTCHYVVRPGQCLIDDARFLRWLTDDNGYLDVRLAAGGRRYVAIRGMNFTFAIVGGQIGNYSLDRPAFLLPRQPLRARRAGGLGRAGRSERLASRSKYRPAR
jgi:hypothetical protein